MLGFIEFVVKEFISLYGNLKPNVILVVMQKRQIGKL